MKTRGNRFLPFLERGGRDTISAIRNPRMTAHRAPSWPVMNRILIAAKRSRIAVIRFGLLSIYNEHVAPLPGFPGRIVVRLHTAVTILNPWIWKITNPFLTCAAPFMCRVIVLLKIKRRHNIVSKKLATIFLACGFTIGWNDVWFYYKNLLLIKK